MLAKRPIVFIFFSALLAILFSPSASFAILKSPDEMAANSKQMEVKTFHEWKSSKVSEIELKIKHLKERLSIDLQRSFASDDPNLKSAERGTEAGSAGELTAKIDQETLNLANIEDLTITDYFVGYLAKQRNLDEAIRAVSLRLQPDEVAELMTVFSKKIELTGPSLQLSEKSANSDK